jgi:hypothetical protein
MALLIEILTFPPGHLLFSLKGLHTAAEHLDHGEFNGI